MYKRINVYDTDSERWMDYTVTSNSTEFNGYVEDSKGSLFHFYKPSNEYEVEREIPVFHTSVGIGRKTCVKPSILKRRFLQCRRDEYKHLFTNVVRKTVEETHDVYYNDERNKFIDKVSKRNYFREYYYV